MGQKFEVERPGVLTVDDIRNGDRAFVMTESGNRYMLRRSKSANGAIKIYNEKKDKFQQGYELYNQGEIARVGEGFNFVMSLSQTEGQKYSATRVVGIEIRRGIDDAIENSGEERKSNVSGLAEELIGNFHAKDFADAGDPPKEEDIKNFLDKLKKK